jgi:hypothetical protein
VKSITSSSTLDALRPVQYIKNEKQEFGFLAHEVQEYFPELVHGEKDGPEMQTLNYMALIPLLTKEIQDLKERVEYLETRN